MCLPWCKKQWRTSFPTWNRDSTLQAFVIAEGMQQGMVATNHRPQLQRMMLITVNIVCMLLPRICKAFGVNHVGRILLLSWTHVILIYCSYVKRGVGKRMRVSSRKKVTTFILAVVPIIRALEFACRPSLFHKFPVLLFMHIPTEFAAYISPWRPGGSEFSVFTFQRLGMRMAQWNKCMMCWTLLLMHALRQGTYRS